jgi:hypothetical protein
MDYGRLAERLENLMAGDPRHLIIAALLRLPRFDRRLCIGESAGRRPLESRDGVTERETRGYRRF